MTFEEMWAGMVRYLNIDLLKEREKLTEAMTIVYSQKKLYSAKGPSKSRDLAENLVYTTKQAILLRRMNIIGLKMRIYMERQKALNSIEFLRQIKNGKIKHVLKQTEFEKVCIMNKTIKREIEEKTNIDQFRQFHVDMDATSSCVLGFMTSITYMNADLWETTNLLTMSNHLLMRKLNEYDQIYVSIKESYEIFGELQKTDYDVLYKKYAHGIQQMSSKDKFEYLELKANERFNSLENMVTKNCYDNNSSLNVNLTDMVSEMVLDNIMLRKLLYNASKKIMNIMIK